MNDWLLWQLYWRTGDVTARETLVQNWMGLVHRIVGQLAPRAGTLPATHLLQAGTMALTQAVDAYDPSCDVDFGSFAESRINKAIENECEPIAPRCGSDGRMPLDPNRTIEGGADASPSQFDRLRASVFQLPERHRLVLALAYVEGLGVADIALVLGLSPTRIAQIHRTALENVRSRTADVEGRARVTNA